MAWRNSEGASLFANPNFLKSIGFKSIFYGGYKNEQLLIVWPLVEMDNEYNSPPPFSYYFGPYVVRSPVSDAPYKRYKNHYEVLNILIVKIKEVAPRIQFAVPPEFVDLRPFQWYKYHDGVDEQFSIQLKYTARMHLNEFFIPDKMIACFRPDDKRKKIKKIIKNNLLRSRKGDSSFIDKYIELYLKTMRRTGGVVSGEYVSILERLLELSCSNLICEDVRPVVIDVECLNVEDPVGFQLLILGNGSSNAIVQGVNDLGRELDVNVFLIYESIKFSIENKIYLFDFNGANSPNRADDKHAFGSIPVPFYEID